MPNIFCLATKIDQPLCTPYANERPLSSTTVFEACPDLSFRQVCKSQGNISQPTRNVKNDAFAQQAVIRNDEFAEGTKRLEQAEHRLDVFQRKFFVVGKAGAGEQVRRRVAQRVNIYIYILLLVGLFRFVVWRRDSECKNFEGA